MLITGEEGLSGITGELHPGLSGMNGGRNPGRSGLTWGMEPTPPGVAGTFISGAAGDAGVSTENPGSMFSSMASDSTGSDKLGLKSILFTSYCISL